MNYFRRLFELVGKDKVKFIFGLFFAFFKNFSFMFIFGALYIAFLNIHALTATVIWNCLMIMIGGILFHFVFRYLEDILVSAEGYVMFRNFRLQVGDELKKAPLGYFDDAKLGNIQGAMTTSINALENFTMMLVTGVIAGFGISILLTIAMLKMNVTLGLFMVPVLVILSFTLGKLYKIAMRNVPLQHKVEQEMNFAVIDMIRGMSVLRTYPINEDNPVKNMIQEKAKDLYAKKKEVDVRCEVEFSWRAKIYSFIVNAASVILIILTVHLYMHDEINFANCMTMLVGSYLIFLGLAPLSDTAFLYAKIPGQQKYLDDVFQIPQLEEGKQTAINGPLDIRFDHVWFGYRKDTPVIKDLSFEIKQNEKVAIVGPSGCGKTTIVNLLSRFWDVDKGAIYLAGKDIREYTVETLFKQMSVVFQDVYLFNDTIMNNIRFAKPEATDQEIFDVCQKARCAEFISKLPQGYETVIGEGGANLSGGEKQRISIARALLKDAPIILLDEATSSVDPENEAEILAAIDELCKGKTVISIAHRISTVESVDHILVINDGSLQEEGKHEELIQNGGIYAGFIKSRRDAKGWRIEN